MAALLQAGDHVLKFGLARYWIQALQPIVRNIVTVDYVRETNAVPIYVQILLRGGLLGKWVKCNVTFLYE